MIQETLVAKEYSEIVFRSRKKPAVSKNLKYPIFQTKKKEKYDSYQIRTNNFCHTCIFIFQNRKIEDSLMILIEFYRISF
jgi:hypothetical protein